MNKYDPEGQYNAYIWETTYKYFNKPIFFIYNKDPITYYALKIFKDFIQSDKKYEYEYNDNSHFLQEINGEDMAHRIIDFINKN